MTDDFQADIAAVSSIDAVPRILEVVCRTTGMGFAAVARVTDTRWVACAVRDGIGFGLTPGGELKIETTICDEIRDSGKAVVIDHVAQHPVYCGHPTPGMYGFQSYISMPIVLPDGAFFGTLCAIDPKPAHLDTPETVGMFRLFAELIAFHLAAADRLASSEAVLLTERKSSELREQFIAVLGHDLRNPLAAIDAGTRLLLKTPVNEKAAGLIAQMQSSVQRMSALIDNVLDFARGRLGGGLTLNLSTEALEPLFRQVIAELLTSYPHREIAAEFAIAHPVSADRVRMAQLLSNLLGNALAYSADGGPIQVRAATDGENFELWVSNTGEPIAPEAMERLFHPFSRGTVQSSQQGLGLGLYIASEIARAHGGILMATCTPQETRFTFRMPLA